MNHFFTSPNNLISGYSPDHISLKITPPLKVKHTCICCSNTLLRHVSFGRIYWRCSYCYQEMPVYRTPSDELKIYVMILSSVVMLDEIASVTDSVALAMQELHSPSENSHLYLSHLKIRKKN